MQISNHYTPYVMRKAYVVFTESTNVLFIQENYTTADTETGFIAMEMNK